MRRPFLLLVALLALAAPAARAEAPGAPLRVRVAAEGRALRLAGPDGVARYDLAAWRGWARAHLAAQVRLPIELGPARLGVDDLARFGPAAAAPDGTRALFTVTGYALLTTVSLVGVLDAATLEPRMFPAPRFGDVEAPTWSPDGGRVAYALGSARAAGEELRVDVVADGRSRRLERAAMHDAWLAAGLPAAGIGPDAYAPRFRDLAWSADGARLAFTVDPPGAPSGEPTVELPPGEAAPPAVPWRFSVGRDGGAPRPEGPALSCGRGPGAPPAAPRARRPRARARRRRGRAATAATATAR